MKRPLALIGFTLFIALMLLHEVDKSWVFFVIFGVCAALGLGFGALAFYKKNPIMPESHNRAYAIAALTVAAACLISWVGTQSQLELNERYAEKTANVTAQAVEISAPRYGRYYTICKAISVDGEAANFRFRLSQTMPFSGDEGDIFSEELSFFEYSNPSKRVSLGAFCPYVMETQAPPAGIGAWVFTLRSRLLSAIDEFLPNEYGALAKGLMLGEISGLSPRTNADFRTLGLTHIIAVSGQHLVIWCVAILMPLFKLLRTKKRLQAGIISGFILVFMALTGFPDSIVRAGLMLLLTQAGVFFNRRADALNSLGFAVLAMCLVSPISAQSLGLQLSFFATLGILLGNQLPEKERKPLKSETLAKVRTFIAETAKYTLLATLFTLPVSIRVSGVLGLLSVPANIIFAIPAGFAMVLSGMCGVFYLIPVLNIFTPALVFLTGLCAKFMLDASRLLAAVPFAALSARGTGMTIWLCGSLILAACFVLFARKSNLRSFLKITALLCVILLIAAQMADYFALGGTSFTPVPTGAVSVVVTKNNRALLLGGEGDGFNAVGEIANALPQLGSVEAVLTGGGKEETDNITALYSEGLLERAYISEDSLTYLLPAELPLSPLPPILEWEGMSLEFCDGAVLICVNGVRILVLFTASVPQEFLPADALIVPGAIENLPAMAKIVSVANTEEHARFLAQSGLPAVSFGVIAVSEGIVGVGW
ncbi:MAG: ComEC/Rec2 family competence protein [Oscillospiraceae bacterium]|nr:ComEC/Rec2 family competence protein [Oscillospiraceae bacterium]